MNREHSSTISLVPEFMNEQSFSTKVTLLQNENNLALPDSRNKNLNENSMKKRRVRLKVTPSFSMADSH